MGRLLDKGCSGFRVGGGFMILDGVHPVGRKAHASMLCWFLVFTVSPGPKRSQALDPEKSQGF